MKDWLFSPERIAVHLPTSTAVVADLHLGYAETRRRCGDAVPEQPMDEVLSPLLAVSLRHPVRQLVIAGDFLEGCLPAGLVARFVRMLRGLAIELAGVVPGNHDRRLETDTVRLFSDGYTLDDWLVVHGDRPVANSRIVQGHVHPCLRVPGGRSHPCYLLRENHIIVPAFSQDAAGVNVLSHSNWNAYRCHVCAEGTVLDFGEVGALRQRLRKQKAHPKK